jgi:Leucine Rich repeat
MRPQRRWLSFSLRALFVTVTLVCVCLAWLAVIAQRARRQERAVESIKALRGYVMFDYGRDAGGKPIEGDAYYDADPAQEWRSAEPAWPPAWLRKLIGDEHFRAVTLINLGRRAPTPNDLAILADVPQLTGLFLFENLSVNDQSMRYVAPLANIANLRKLKRLWITQTAITDAGLAIVGQLPALELLDVRYSPGVTDEGLSHLARLGRLHELSISHTAITDEGLAHLAGLMNLDSLDLTETLVAGAGLRHLAGLPNLKGLYLGHTPMADPCMAILPSLSARLERLTLEGTIISDAGLAEVAKLTSLECLSLLDTGITDAGLSQLASLTGLKELYLPSKGTTPAGIARLQAALPKCKIIASP